MGLHVFPSKQPFSYCLCFVPCILSGLTFDILEVLTRRPPGRCVPIFYYLCQSESQKQHETTALDCCLKYTYAYFFCFLVIAGYMFKMWLQI